MRCDPTNDIATLVEAFGFDNTEWSSGADIGYYRGSETQKRSRIRPGGGVVFRKHFGWYVPTFTDPNKAGIIPEAFGRFYMEFQDRWTLENEELFQALNDARLTAQGIPNDLANPPWQPGVADNFGYRNLRHNEFNRKSANW